MESVSFSSTISVLSGNTLDTVTLSLWSFSKDNSGNISVSQIGSAQTKYVSPGSPKDITISATGLNLTSSDSVFLLISPQKKGYGTGAQDPTYTVSNFSLTGSTIPEPSAFGLLVGVGALALAVSRRRRVR